MVKRARDLFEEAPLVPPTTSDLKNIHSVKSWVSSNVLPAMQLDAIYWLGDPACRMRIAGCKTKAEFLSVVDALSEPDASPPPPAPEASPAPAADRDPLRRARDVFFQPVEDEDMLEELWGKVQRDYNSWTQPTTSHQHLAPCFAVVQSSGWGKSKLVWELHQKGVYTVYVSCVKPDVAGFPGRTPYLADWLCQADASLQSMAAFMIASMQILSLFVPSATPAQWLRMQMDPLRGFPLAPRIHKACLEVLNELQSSTLSMEAQRKEKRLKKQQQMPGFQKTWWGRGLYRHKEKVSDEYQLVGEALGNALARLPIAGDACADAQKPLKLLFCIDDAMSLAELTPPAFPESNFTLLRRVFGSVGHGIWGLLLGVDSKSSSFSHPPSGSWRRHSSGRFPPPRYKLFRSLCLTGKSVSSSQLEGNGRPLWRALLESGHSPDELLAVAVKKLNVNPDKLTEAMVAGVLGCTIGLQVAAWSSVADECVAHHMMTSSWISDDGKLIHVMNAAEPILAAAGSRFLLDRVTLCKLVRLVSKMCMDGGSRQKLVTRLLVLLAILECLRDNGDDRCTGPVTLEQFLIKLLGRVPDGLASAVDLESELRMNGFTPTYRDLSQELLAECFRLHTGLTCKPGQPVVDNVLPTNNGNVGILVADKGNSKRGVENSAARLEDGVDGLEFMLGLMLQLGSEAKQVQVAGARIPTIVVSGLSREVFPFVDEDVVAALQEFLNVEEVSHLSLMSVSERELAKHALPISY